MNIEIKVDRASLENRELEIERLIRQMKSDQLHKSPVYKKLEEELLAVKNQLIILDNKI